MEFRLRLGLLVTKVSSARVVALVVWVKSVQLLLTSPPICCSRVHFPRRLRSGHYTESPWWIRWIWASVSTVCLIKQAVIRLISRWRARTFQWYVHEDVSSLFHFGYRSPHLVLVIFITFLGLCLCASHDPWGSSQPLKDIFIYPYGRLRLCSFLVTWILLDDDIGRVSWQSEGRGCGSSAAMYLYIVSVRQGL